MLTTITWKDNIYLITLVQLGGVHNVDYYENTDTNQNEGFLGGDRTWTISPVDAYNKFSKKLYNCTGLVVAEESKDGSENLSFETHQDPEKFLVILNHSKFVADLQKRLNEIKEKCRAGTIDAVLLGGKYPIGTKLEHAVFRESYIDSIKYISREVVKTLGFEPVVINGPKTKIISGADDIYYDNKNRRLYFMRPKIDFSAGHFTQSSLAD